MLGQYVRPAVEQIERLKQLDAEFNLGIPERQLNRLKPPWWLPLVPDDYVVCLNFLLGNLKTSVGFKWKIIARASPNAWSWPVMMNQLELLDSKDTHICNGVYPSFKLEWVILNPVNGINARQGVVPISDVWSAGEEVLSLLALNPALIKVWANSDLPNGFWLPGLRFQLGHQTYTPWIKFRIAHFDLKIMLSAAPATGNRTYSIPRRVPFYELPLM
jgi:hypothetical protein